MARTTRSKSFADYDDNWYQWDLYVDRAKNDNVTLTIRSTDKDGKEKRTTYTDKASNPEIVPPGGFEGVEKTIDKLYDDSDETNADFELEVKTDTWDKSRISRGLRAGHSARSDAKTVEASIGLANQIKDTLIKRGSDGWQKPLATLSVLPNTPLPADGAVSSFTIAVVLRGVDRKPEKGTTVALEVSGSENVVSGDGTTDEEGRATFKLASTKAESKTISLTATRPGRGGVALDPKATVVFVAIDGSSAKKDAPSGGAPTPTKGLVGALDRSTKPEKPATQEKPAKPETFAYTIKKGDRLWKMTQFYGKDVLSFTDDKGVTNEKLLAVDPRSAGKASDGSRLIFEGQTIWLPKTPAAPEGQFHFDRAEKKLPALGAD